MNVLQRIVVGIRTRLRRKLLALVLFPILLIVPAALGLTVWWGSRFTYEQLFFKVNTDLSVADDAFERVRRDYLFLIERLAESYTFRTSLEADNALSIRAQLEMLEKAYDFSYLWITDKSGRRLYMPRDVPRAVSKSSPLRIAAAQGEKRTGIEIFSEDELQMVSPDTPAKVRLPLLKTPLARPSERREETRGMMIRIIYPLLDGAGEIQALLDGGVLLNGNFDFVDGIRDLVYGPGSLLSGSIGTVTVFLDDVRISTNVPLREGERALGTRVSDAVRTRVLDEGHTWVDRAFVVNDWYISAYEPIVDTLGRRVGMLYAGYLEQPYRYALLSALTVLVLLFIALMGFSASLAIWGARSIFSPVESMSRVVAAIRRGEHGRIGEINSRDELGELARQFDMMLALLQRQHRRIQGAANELEQKVDERTLELRRSNEELRQTIQVLRQTRQQLVMAEKLAAVGELTAGVAHEINNPTAVMLGNLENVINELGTAADPVREDLELVIEQIYRIKDIVNNLLQYARPDRYAGYLGEVDVNDAIRQSLRFVEHLSKEKNCKVELRLEADVKVKISQHELQQVLVNLLVNAIHALPERDGEVEISTHDWADRGAVIHVYDNGHGIAPEQMDQVFNPFYSTKEQGEGTGLGLSVSYGLVRRYGGLITVESHPDKGTLFSVYLLTEPEFHEDEETLVEQLGVVVTDGGRDEADTG